MSWTTPAQLRAKTLKLWEQGRLLACLVEAGELFPLSLSLKLPGSAELSDRFDEVRTWSRALRQGAKGEGGLGYRLVLREVRHRVIGSNVLPEAAWLDTLDDALALAGKRREALAFGRLIALTREQQPALLPWLRDEPLRALALGDDWLRLLDVVAWLKAHPRPGVYLRQVDLPGVHSKFIETHRAVVSELLDLSLDAAAIDAGAGGVANFARRYGFRAKPVRVRLRVLDTRQALLPGAADQDLGLNHDTFASLDPAASRIFITENEINFLAFPALADSLVIFGAGYGFEMLAQATWLQQRRIHYWGDIDTHGFAILDQLRAHFAHAESFLMDRETLMVHRSLWADEPQPTLRDLPRLHDSERALFDDLRWKRLDGERALRLEQERIGFGWVQAALRALAAR